MVYLFKEKFNLLDLVPVKKQPLKLVMILEPEEYLLSLYSHYLERNNFQVKHCRQVDALHKEIHSHHPDLLILNTGIFKQLGALVDLLTELRQSFAGLPVVTIGHNINGEDISKMMATGISSHIDRRLSRPRDVVHVVEAILNLKS
jgi:DNA-binding response OmpR family regulator